MPNLEWDVPHDIVSPVGTLHLNQIEAVTGRLWQIKPDGYKIVPSLRVTSDNLSQSDGAILHPRYKTGLVATMTVEYHISNGGVDYTPACGVDLVEMHELLVRHLDVMRRLKGTQRLLWSPTGFGDTKILDQIQTVAWAEPERDGIDTGVTFALETEFSYAVTGTGVTTPISNGSSATLTNAGTSTFKPVVKAYGPFTAFSMVNNNDLDPFGNPKQLSYDSTRPGAVAVGGGDYAEIDFFKGSVFLNGNGAELIAGFDPGVTDFFDLVYGDNVIAVSGCGVDVLWNEAWS